MRFFSSEGCLFFNRGCLFSEGCLRGVYFSIGGVFLTNTQALHLLLTNTQAILCTSLRGLVSHFIGLSCTALHVYYLHGENCTDSAVNKAPKI